jgi:hypothetical protein
METLCNGIRKLNKWIISASTQVKREREKKKKKRCAPKLHNEETQNVQPHMDGYLSNRLMKTGKIKWPAWKQLRNK